MIIVNAKMTRMVGAIFCCLLLFQRVGQSQAVTHWVVTEDGRISSQVRSAILSVGRCVCVLCLGLLRGVWTFCGLWSCDYSLDYCVSNQPDRLHTRGSLWLYNALEATALANTTPLPVATPTLTCLIQDKCEHIADLWSHQGPSAVMNLSQKYLRLT